VPITSSSAPVWSRPCTDTVASPPRAAPAALPSGLEASPPIAFAVIDKAKPPPPVTPSSERASPPREPGPLPPAPPLASCSRSSRPPASPETAFTSVES